MLLVVEEVRLQGELHSVVQLTLFHGAITQSPSQNSVSHSVLCLLVSTLFSYKHSVSQPELCLIVSILSPS